jgi:8-oxo-dGTP pyrophosphatase MutT (NUDIX family)
MQRHFTASAFVVDSHKRVLLLWHKKLNRWMPPGGHVDENELPEETAKRECKEETGLDVEIVGDAQEDVFARNRNEGQILKKPFCFLLEEIPATKEQPAHQHMDFVYLARPVDETQTLTLEEEEGRELRWFTLSEIEKLGEDEIFANVRGYILLILSNDK